jgi:mono/diheme cytochrome c family protein
VSRMKLACLFLVAACSDPDTVTGEPPSPNPPPSWGVPITGGNMIVSRDGNRAVVADPDRDRIAIVDLVGTGGVIADLALTANDEPGRLVEDGAGRVHVALRRGNAIVTVDLATAAITARRPACVEPRGLAWDSATDNLHVACASGELVTLAATGGDVTRRLRLDRDLRDVIVDGNNLIVTRFRASELIKLDAQGAIISRSTPPNVKRFDSFGGGFDIEGGSADGLVDAVAAVAWRTIPTATGGIVTLHQRQLKKKLGAEQQGGYGGGCGGGPIEAAVSITTSDPVTGALVTRAVRPPVLGALPVDIALNKSGDTFAVALAGSQVVHQVRTVAFGEDHDDDDDDPCPIPGGDDATAPIQDQLGAPTSLAYLNDGSLAIFYPEAPAIAVHTISGQSRIIPMTGGFGYDSGRGLFHQQTSVGIACASCHPEGRDDGLVWDFAEFGLRRTQNLGGGILARAPYHWVGDMKDLTVLMDDVFAVRMAGGTPTRSQHLSLGPWLDRIPAPQPAPVLDAAAVARGKALFDSDAVGCASCHGGAVLTNNLLVNVGTAGTFKVPSLVGVAGRAPYMHDGCAPTLADRFGACGGGDLHGRTSQLDAAQRADLIAYLESL